MNHQAVNLCYRCNDKMRLIGTSERCTICAMRKVCQSFDCSDLVNKDSQYCVKCERIQYLCSEIKSLKETVKNYEREEEERNKTKMEIINE
jgi:hypothetical protein